MSKDSWNGNSTAVFITIGLKATHAFKCIVSQTTVIFEFMFGDVACGVLECMVL